MTHHNPVITALLLAGTLTLPAFARVALSVDNERVDALAIYNQGAAVVQTTREVALEAGVQSIVWPMNGRLRADTLWLEGDGVRLTGLTANAYDDSGQRLLAARVGQPVTLLRDDAVAEARTREGRLVGVNGDTVWVRVDGRIERLTGNSPWRLAWPAAEERAQGLQLQVAAEKAGTRALTATYQIDGPSWQASYTGRFDPESGTLELASLALIDNSDGGRLAAEKAWLVAGDVARSNGSPQPMMMARAEAKASDAAAQQANGDTYRYVLEEGIDVAAGAIRAASIMAPLRFEATRIYRVESATYAARREAARGHAQVRLAFENTRDAPLPAGVVRVYNSAGRADLMGEDRIGATPKDAPVELTLGTAFDLTSERKLVEDTKSGDDQRRRTVEITLHNASQQKARVEVVEHLPQTAIIDASCVEPASDSPANTAVWHVYVPAGGKTTLCYTAVWGG